MTLLQLDARLTLDCGEQPGADVARPVHGHRNGIAGRASPLPGAGLRRKCDPLDLYAKCIYILCMITWDEPKRLVNLRKHKIDLADLEPVFDNPMVSVEDAREGYGEFRLQSLGIWHERVVFLVWTPRGEDTAHLISCRYADRKEANDYFSTL